MAGYAAWLKERAAAGNLRCLRPVARIGPGRLRLGSGPELLDFSSNDYLGLSRDPELIAAARQGLEMYGAGSGAARLMSGDLELFHELEAAVAGLKRQPAALVFGSGFAANTGIIPALVGRNDTVIVDRLCHASIYDGCRLSGATLIRCRHNDMGHLEECLARVRGRGLLVVESVYSMDGDLAPLREIVALKEAAGAMLMVDEAHATGVFGKNGAGAIAAAGLTDRVEVAMGTFGKALGSYGAYVAADAGIITLLLNRARSFIYSTALPPAVVAANLAAIRLMGKRPGMGGELLARARFFKEELIRQGIAGEPGPSQIVPLLIGDSAAAMSLVEQCLDGGLFLTAARPPTVEPGRARLRLSVTLDHAAEDLSRAAEVIAAAAAGLGLRPEMF